MAQTPPPIIPVYLNQRIVFDVLAMLQDGLSQVTRVTSTENASETATRDVGAAFGVSQAFASLLKIDLSAKRTNANVTAAERELNEERVHTPGSLLYKLRQLLREHDLISDPSSDTLVSPGQIVEFTTTLKRNPIIQLIDSMLAALRMRALFSDEPPPVKRKQHHRSPPDESEKLTRQFETLREDLVSGSTVDIVSGRLQGGATAVITLDIEYLADPKMANLVEGQFSVLGKVISCVGDDSSINLLRKTAMGLLPQQLLAAAFSHFDSLSESQSLNTPKAEWLVPGPAVHILPIAIYA